MSAETIHQPHDKLFRQGFGEPANAAAFLRLQFPAAVAEAIEWDRLALEPGTFVDSHFRLTESDLLFSAPLPDRECLLYFLFEHQICEDRQLALRLLRYMVRIWEAWIKSHPEWDRLPVILPVVLAQNAQEWSLVPQFSALLDLPPALADDLRSFIPDFAFQLIQLAVLPFEAIRGTPAGIMILRTMKAERVAALLSDPVWDEALLAQLPRETWELLVRYILNADVDKEGFDGRVKALQQPETQLTAMTLAERIREDGLQQGLERGMERGLEKGLQSGRLEGLRDGILEALEIRFGVVPIGLTEAVRAISDEPHLRRLHKAAIQAATVDEFAGGL